MSLHSTRLNLGELYAAATSEYAPKVFKGSYRVNKLGLYSSLFKRLLDICIAFCFLLLLMPVCFAIAIAIRMESQGPIIFSQTRVGKNGSLFRLYKFRSMVPDAETRTGPVWAFKDDPRVTKVGRFIRRTRLDELPQLINVIKGDMSLVGPRPERPIFVQQFAEELPQFPLRLAVKPGLTGLAQVCGGYDHTPRQKLRYDLLYIKQLSFWLDLFILFRTVWVVLFGAGAR